MSLSDLSEEPLPDSQEEAPFEPGDLAGVPLTFATSCLLADGKVDHFYFCGALASRADPAVTVSIIGICVGEGGKILVAVPGASWHRSPDKRVLPSSALAKVQSVSVQACDAAERTPISGLSVRVWLGYLKADFVDPIRFDVGEASVGFGESDRGPVVPLAEGLAALAEEKFGFVTADSKSGDGGGTGSMERRLATLEGSLEEIRASLAALAKGTSGDASRGRQPKGASRPVSQPRPVGRDLAGREQREPEEALAGLDQGVVRSALASGISVDQLREVSRLVSAKPKKLADIPRPSTAKANIQSESEAEEVVVDGGAVEEDPEGSGSMAKALLRLTEIASSLSEAKVKKDPLEALLDQGASGSAGGGGESLTGGKKSAAALRALQRQLVSNPKYVYETIEANLLSDFASAPVAPGQPWAPGASTRGWLSTRSRLQNYATHVRWTWAACGIWDCLIAGKTAEARARVALLVAASDQAAIDGGSWMVAQTGLLEPSPPYHMFNNHSLPSAHESQSSALYDPRWLDVFVNHIRDLDSYQDAKRKLGRGKERAPPPGDKDAPEAKTAAKARAEHKFGKEAAEAAS